MVAAEQLGHDVFVRSRSGTSCGDPLVVCRKVGLDLRLFQGLRRGVPFYRTEPPQLYERDDGGGLAAEVDDLVRLGRFWVFSRLRTHRVNRTGQDGEGADEPTATAQLAGEADVVDRGRG